MIHFEIIVVVGGWGANPRSSKRKRKKEKGKRKEKEKDKKGTFFWSLSHSGTTLGASSSAIFTNTQRKIQGRKGMRKKGDFVFVLIFFCFCFSPQKTKTKTKTKN